MAGAAVDGPARGGAAVPGPHTLAGRSQPNAAALHRRIGGGSHHPPALPLGHQLVEEHDRRERGGKHHTHPDAGGEGPGAEARRRRSHYAQPAPAL